MKSETPTTPSLPTTAISAEPPSSMTYSSDTIALVGKVDVPHLPAGLVKRVPERHRNQLQVILNSANFSSIATDEKGVIQIFNVGAERMLGYAAADVMNRITPADISDPQEVVARARP
jgi:PAS domain-containing protein